MPQEIIVSSSLKVGQTMPGIIKHFVDRREKRTPAPITMLSASTLRIGDDDTRHIVSAITQDGETNFLGGSGSSPAAQIRWQKLAQLAQATKSLTEAVTALNAAGLINHAARPEGDDESEDYGGLVQALQLVFDRIRQERERLQAMPRSETKQMEPPIHVLTNRR